MLDLPVALALAQTGRDSSFFTGSMAALAGLMFGLDIGVISGALQLIGVAFHAPDTAQERIVSSMMFGAASGALGAGELSFRLGRKTSLIVAAILFIIGSLCCAFSWSIVSLIVAGIVLGVAIGIATFTASLYISEIAPPDRRGAMIPSYQLMITIGISRRLPVGYGALLRRRMAMDAGNRRRAGSAVPGRRHASDPPPRWLLMRGRKREATAVLARAAPRPARGRR